MIVGTMKPNKSRFLGASFAIAIGCWLFANQARAEFAECDMSETAGTATIAIGGIALVGLIIPSIHFIHRGKGPEVARIPVGASLLFNGAGMVTGGIMGILSYNNCHDRHGGGEGLAYTNLIIGSASIALGIVNLVLFKKEQKDNVSFFPVIFRDRNNKLLPAAVAVITF